LDGPGTGRALLSIQLSAPTSPKVSLLGADWNPLEGYWPVKTWTKESFDWTRTLDSKELTSQDAWLGGADCTSSYRQPMLTGYLMESGSWSSKILGIDGL